MIFPSQRIVDIHTHLNSHGHSARAVVDNMDRLGIERAWALTLEAPPDEFGQRDHRYLSPHKLGIPFEDVVSAIEQYPERFVPAWAIDPRRPDAIDRLRAAIDTYGVRVFGELKLRVMYDDLDVIEMFEVCAELALPVVLHLEIVLPNPGESPARPTGERGRRLWYGGDLDTLGRVLERCRATTFIGHAAGFWREISGDASAIPEMYPRGAVQPGGRLVDLLRTHSNLYCDLGAESGLNALTRDPNNARWFLDTFQDRVLFGRDGFDDRLLAFLSSLDLNEAVLSKILSKNALGLLSMH